MNRIIIIGNGFDLAHGLKTSFYDFIGDYLKGVVRKVWKEKRYEDELIKILINTNHPSIVKQNQDISSVNINSNSSIIDFFCRQIKNNGGLRVLSMDVDESEITRNSFAFSDLLSKILTSLSENKRWVDIEQDYFDLLTEVQKQNKGFNKEQIIETVKDINCQLIYLKEKLLYYIQNKNQEINIAVGLSSQFQQENRKRDYIGNISGKFPSKYYFLNFNYTNTLDKYLIHINNDVTYELNHIHGSLCETHGSPIFGYADDLNEDFKAFEKENINELYHNIKTFAYNDEANYANLMRTLNEGDFQVAIYGHSCGLSDRTLLNRIFEHKNCNQ